MKKIFHSSFIIALAIFAIFYGSCKGRSSETTKTDTATTVTPAVTDNTVQKAPDTSIVISGNDSLKNMLPDALKDFPGVTATVDQGVITLTGNITRSKLPQLMKSVNALHPKKVNNNLTIQ